MDNKWYPGRLGVNAMNYKKKNFFKGKLKQMGFTYIITSTSFLLSVNKPSALPSTYQSCCALLLSGERYCDMLCQVSHFKLIIW